MMTFALVNAFDDYQKGKQIHFDRVSSSCVIKDKGLLYLFAKDIFQCHVNHVGMSKLP